MKQNNHSTGNNISINLFPTVFNHKGMAVTTSLDVAKFFGKEHKNILQTIKGFLENSELGELNFQPSYYRNEQNKRLPMYRMDRDAFTFLVMGFTGKKANLFKLAYIQRFNDMERWIDTRQGLSDHQYLLNDAVQYRELTTGKKDDHAYSRENNLIYCVAIGASRKKWLQLHNLPLDDDIRQHLSKEHLKLVDLLISENATMIKLNMDYSSRKERLQQSALYYWQPLPKIKMQ